MRYSRAYNSRAGGQAGRSVGRTLCAGSLAAAPSNASRKLSFKTLPYAFAASRRSASVISLPRFSLMCTARFQIRIRTLESLVIGEKHPNKLVRKTLNSETLTLTHLSTDISAQSRNEARKYRTDTHQPRRDVPISVHLRLYGGTHGVRMCPVGGDGSGGGGGGGYCVPRRRAPPYAVPGGVGGAWCVVVCKWVGGCVPQTQAPQRLRRQQSSQSC